jgi:hypothetical protein
MKHDIGPLGALILVVLLGAGIMYAFLHGRSMSPPSHKRLAAYYESAAGGSIPAAAFDRLTFEGCRDTKTTAGEAKVYRCRLGEGGRTYSPCFIYGGDSGNVLIGTTATFEVNHRDLGCGLLTYIRRTNRFVFVEQCIVLPVGTTGTRRIC